MDEKAKEKEGGKYGGLKNHTALLGKRRVCHYTDKRKYGKTMEQLAYRLLFDYQDTEECCSDTYWDLWNALPPNRPIHFKAFIMRYVAAMQ